jgi:hypothetical protein
MKLCETCAEKLRIENARKEASDKQAHELATAAAERLKATVMSRDFQSHWSFWVRSQWSDGDYTIHVDNHVNMTRDFDAARVDDLIDVMRKNPDEPLTEIFRREHARHEFEAKGQRTALVLSEMAGKRDVSVRFDYPHADPRLGSYAVFSAQFLGEPVAIGYRDLNAVKENLDRYRDMSESENFGIDVDSLIRELVAKC